MKSDSIITKTKREFNSAKITEDIPWFKQFNWTKEIWTSKDALIDKEGGITHLFYGQVYNKTKFDIIKNGWTHEHCDICFSGVRNGDICYTHEGEMICDLCYIDFIKEEV